MPTRIEDIFTRVRDTLADPNQERWLDAQLIRLLDEGQKILASHAGYIKDRIQVQMVPGMFLYTLPDTVHKITRVLDKNGLSLPLYTHEEMDNLHGMRWETLRADPIQAIVFDRIKTNEIKVYPIPNVVDPALVTPATPIYGFTTSLLDVAVTGTDSPYGVATGLSTPSVDFLILYCLMNATTITSVNDTLECNPVFDTALKYYITGMCLRDDKDTQNRQVGAEELAFFRQELKMLTRDAAQNFTTNPDTLTVDYNGGF